MHNWLAWVSIGWATLHDAIYVGIYVLLQRWGVIAALQRRFPWMRAKPRHLTEQEMRQEVMHLHTRLHVLETALEKKLP